MLFLEVRPCTRIGYASVAWARHMSFLGKRWRTVSFDAWGVHVLRQFGARCFAFARPCSTVDAGNIQRATARTDDVVRQSIGGT